MGDLRFRLRSRKRVPLQGSCGVTGTRSVHVIHVIHVPVPVIHVPDYLAVGPGSASGVWAVVLGMHGTHLKYRQCLNRSVSITEDLDWHVW